MEQPKDYVEYLTKRFSQRNLDDAWLRGMLIGIVASIVFFAFGMSSVRFLPIGWLNW